MKFPTHAVLGTSTGRLLGDIGGIYDVISFLIGRPAYTHELVYYGRQASRALKTAVPALPGPEAAQHVNKDNYRQYLAAWEQQFGTTIELPDSLRDSLADAKTGLKTLSEMVPSEKIIVIGCGGDSDTV